MALKAARMSRGITQDELAIRSGIAQSAISRIESGGQAPSLRTLVKLAYAMNSELDIFFN